MTRYRNVVFVINNWTQDDKEHLVLSDVLQYFIYAEEIAPSTGTPHLQGYAELSKQLGIKATKKIFGPRAHIENRNGTAQQAIDYVKKINQTPPCEPNPIELITEQGKGEQKKPGKRTDLSHVYEVMKTGNMGDLMKTMPNFQAIRVGEKVEQYRPLSKVYCKKKVIWCWGKTGLGKTRFAYTQIPDNVDFWVSNPCDAWFDGYYGQEYCIIEELRPSTWKYKNMLRLLDGYESRVPVKGSFAIWKAKTVVITTPHDPATTYKGQIDFGDGDIDQLLRRITEVREFKEGEKQPEEQRDEEDNFECLQELFEGLEPQQKKRRLNSEPEKNSLMELRYPEPQYLDCCTWITLGYCDPYCKGVHK